MSATWLLLSRWRGSLLLLCAVFLVTTTEIYPIGLLPEISREFNISEGRAGLSVVLYGIVAGLSAPVLIKLTRRFDRTKCLLVVLFVFVAGNIGCALAQDFTQFLIFRVITGLQHGLVWAMAAHMAISVAPPGGSVRSTVIVFSGISGSVVVGVPFGVFLGNSFGWRVSFFVLAGACFACGLACAALLPKIASGVAATGSVFGLIMRNKLLICAYITTLLYVVGYYAGYTFLRPLLSQIAGVSDATVPIVLFWFGVHGLVGNFLGGFLLEKYGSVRALIILGGAVALSFGALGVIGGTAPAVGIACLLLWSLFYSGLPVCLQSLVLACAPDSRESASSIYVLVFNCAIGLGALAGGIVLDQLSAFYLVAFASGLVAIGAILITLFSRAYRLREVAVGPS